MKVRASVKHVVDQLLTLRCPKRSCGAPFDTFDGCWALTCRMCAVEFCAACFRVGVDGDTHSHVAHCPRKPKVGVWGTPAEFEEVNKPRRLAALREYFDGLKADVRQGVIRSLAPILKLHDLRV